MIGERTTPSLYGEVRLGNFPSGKNPMAGQFSAPRSLPNGTLLAHVAKATELLRETMAKDRQYRHQRKIRLQPPTKIVPGVYVFVHKRTFPSADR